MALPIVSGYSKNRSKIQQRIQDPINRKGMKPTKYYGPSFRQPVPQDPDETNNGFVNHENFTPEQIKILDWARKNGQASFEQGQTGLNQLMQPMSAYDQSLNRIGNLANAGATPGSYGGDIGSLAGGAVGGIFGPGGAAAGSLAGKVGGSLLGNWFDRYQAQGAFEPYEQQARQDYQQRTIPHLAQQFSNLGLRDSSAFGNALSRSAADLESQLATAKSDYNANQLEQLMRQKEGVNQQMNMQSDRELQQKDMMQRYYQGLQNQGLRQMELGLGPQFTRTYQQDEPSNLERFGGPILQQVAQQGTRWALNKAFPGAGEVADVTGVTKKPYESLATVIEYLKRNTKKTRR